MATPFDFVKAIGETEEDLVASGALDVKEMNQFILLQALAHRGDAVDGANLVNGLRLSNKGAWVVLRAVIRRRRSRGGEFWAKAGKVEDIDIVKQYFGVGDVRAQEIIWTVGQKGIDRIKEIVGGPADGKAKKK